VWNVGPILQGLACSILSRIIAAISRLGNTFDDEDYAPNGMSVKRSFATRRVGHLDHDKFPMIAGQCKTFENLAGDTRKSGLLGACPTVATSTHWTPFPVKRRVVVPRSDRGANDYGAPRRSNKVLEHQFYMFGSYWPRAEQREKP
jgi:hypothetical protein